jgi:hypothetical protein
LQAREGVVGVSAVAVEEVFRIVVDTLALPDQEGDRFRDHTEVLLAVDAQRLLDVKIPSLPHDAGDRYPRIGEHA